MTTDLAFLVLRLVVGIAFVFHGLPKIHHPTSWGAHLVPWAPSWLLAFVAVVEVAGGGAFALGLFARIVAFFIACDMAVAVFVVLIPSGASLVAPGGGRSFELELTYLSVAFAILLCGPGRYSIDGTFRGRGGRPTRTIRRR